MLADRDRAFIVWGIENKTKRRLGTTVKLNELKKGAENFANWLSRTIDPRLMMEFLDFVDQGAAFAILTVEPTYDRPVAFRDVAYIRIGENIKCLKEFPPHERALWLATGRRKSEDAVALPHQSADEILKLLSTEIYYQLRGDEIPRNPAEIVRRFTQLSYIQEDMQGGYDILNLGALLFANDIGVFPSIATKSVRVIKYAGRDKSKSEGEAEGKRGYAVGFQGLLKYVMDRLPKEEKFTGGVREAASKYSGTAIREIVANALIHQDFTVPGAGPVIEIYQDRIEISNPGSSLIKVDRIIDERQSRNQKFADSAAKNPVAFRLGDAARQSARQCRMVSGESRSGRELEECRALEAARSAPDDDDRHGRAWRAAAHHRGGDQSSIRPQGGCRWQL
jgi:ATP-dependent DNA helicase RecG